MPFTASSAVKDEGGVLLHLLDALEVECLARNIPEYIEVDVTPLTEIDSMLHAGDIQLPADIKLIKAAQPDYPFVIDLANLV